MEEEPGDEEGRGRGDHQAARAAVPRLVQDVQEARRDRPFRRVAYRAVPRTGGTMFASLVLTLLFLFRFSLSCFVLLSFVFFIRCA